MDNEELDVILAEYEEFVAVRTPARALSRVPVLIDEIHQLRAQASSMGALWKLSEAEVERLKGVVSSLEADIREPT